MAKTRGPSHKAYYSRAAKEMTAIKNRRRKLEKLLRQNPENTQVAEALKNIKYRRKTPGTSVTSCEKKENKGYDSMVKGLRGYTKRIETPTVRAMFSLAHRAHTVNGEYPWLNS